MTHTAFAKALSSVREKPGSKLREERISPRTHLLRDPLVPSARVPRTLHQPVFPPREEENNVARRAKSDGPRAQDRTAQKSSNTAGLSERLTRGAAVLLAMRVDAESEMEQQTMMLSAVEPGTTLSGQRCQRNPFCESAMWNGIRQRVSCWAWFSQSGCDSQVSCVT